MVKIGDQLKDFTLKDQGNQDFNTGTLRGKKILLSFHPLAFTGICADQMKALEDNYETFEKYNTVPLGISVDQQFAKAAWAEELGIDNLRLLADFWPHGGVAESMGVFLADKGIAGRANIIVDETGKVIFVKEYEIPQLPDIQEILDFLKSA